MYLCKEFQVDLYAEPRKKWRRGHFNVPVRHEDEHVYEGKLLRIKVTLLKLIG
jgi:hypothetical protein